VDARALGAGARGQRRVDRRLGIIAYIRWSGGLRATAEPSAVETFLARTVRHWAIPASARRASSPLRATAADVGQGRAVFLAQCADCHSRDGSGLTPTGRGLYPRPPDLRAAATQSLSDGELQYIIANGVPLTGMAAWVHPRALTTDDTWRLVAFIRTLRPSGVAPAAGLAQAAPAPHYVGSAACARCHADLYRRWQQTPMANVVRDPRQAPHAIIPALSSNHVSPFTVDQVALVYGSLWKQRYFTKIGDDYFPLPVQWEVANRRWSKYMVPKGADWWEPFYPADNRQRPTGPTCDGCHSVGYDVQTKRVAEWNVGCERCHGPGSEHVAQPTTNNIVNPGRMDPVAASDTCIQCHSQGRPLTNPIDGRYYDWPVGYNVGLALADFWRLESHTLGQTNFYYFADGTAHKNRMQGNDFAQSVMYRRGVTCADCHDVHGTGNDAQLVKPAQALCLQCHGPSSPNGPRAVTIEAHTHHQVDSAGSQCVACHMPAIESEGVPGTNVHAHTFRFITPAMTDQYGIPNPCTSCHTDKSTAWATDAMRHWPDRSPWRLE
jgi:predicted CXXCH cytochrome family protein